MSAPLLTTKLYIPRIRTGLVSRPRLVERLNEGVRRKLTLISAPAGFGKTTLLSEWVAGCERPVAWVSLDAGDSDLARFLAYLVAALQTIDASVGEGVGKSLQGPQPQPIESVLTTLINQIAVIPDPFILVLDDCHLLTDVSVYHALAFLLDHLPPQMHLVIATRGDPSLPLARLRGRDQMTELRQADLRFTPDEITEFLNDLMSLELSPESVVALASRTEGWIAGLQMAALSMHDRGDRESFIREFTGSHRYILDYLVEEVLDRQPESIKTFLLQTSVLDRLTGSLCDTLLGEGEEGDRRKGDVISSVGQRPELPAHGQEILESLERGNLFVVPLDEHREWYRYHRLFADLLRQRLHQTQPDHVPMLHRRASEWFERQGLLSEAIDHALSAGDLERGAHLVELNAEATFMRSEVATLLRWVEALPDNLVRGRPTLCLFHARALLLSGRPLEAAESRLEDVASSEVDDATFLSTRMALLHALLAYYRGQVARTAELSRRALEGLPKDDQMWRNIAAFYLGVSYLAQGKVEAGRRALDQAAEMGREAGNTMIAVGALRNLARQRRREGQLREARSLYERALELAMDKHGHRLPVAGPVLMGLGELWREWNDLEAATRCLVEGIDLVEEWGAVWAINGYLSLARVKQAKGDVAGSRDAIQQAERLAKEFAATELDDVAVAILKAQLSIAQGDVDAAVRWAEERKLEAGHDSAASGHGEHPLSSHLHEYEGLVLARLLIAQDQPTKALTLLEPLLPRLEREGRNGLVIEVQMLRALALQGQGNVSQALEALARALDLAEPGGYVRLFLDGGPQTERLLRQAAGRGLAPAYVSKLLSGFDVSGREGLSPAQPLVDPLSEREMEVLRLLTTGLSNPEIAQRLFIVTSTVRSHTKSIYAKLNVHRRWDAVERAKELGLL